MSSAELDERQYLARDLALTLRLVEQLISDQFTLDPYVEGVPLVLLPVDDSVLARFNLERAMKFEERGGRVNLRIIHPTRAVGRVAQ